MMTSNNQHIDTLLNCDGVACPVITHGLGTLGGGKMCDGLKVLWSDGYKNGVIRGSVATTMVITVALGSYVLVKKAIEAKRVKQQLSCLNSPIAEETRVAETTGAEAIKEGE